eukprot:3689136-Pleurochrysis_carterae.AAC.1
MMKGGRLLSDQVLQTLRGCDRCTAKGCICNQRPGCRSPATVRRQQCAPSVRCCLGIYILRYRINILR